MGSIEQLHDLETDHGAFARPAGPLGAIALWFGFADLLRVHRHHPLNHNGRVERERDAFVKVIS